MAGVLDADEYQRWRAQADRALVSARATVTAEQYDWACFLAEQAAQLAVKGLLHGAGRAAWGHDLVALEAVARRAAAQAWPEDTSEAAGRLSRHYIPTRYPDAHAGGAPGVHYHASDAEHALDDALAVLAAVDTAWARLTAAGGGP